MVKDLWALRLQLYRNKLDDDPKEKIYNSQTENETEDEVSGESKAGPGRRNLPLPIEGLGICYLGSLLLRLPLSLAQIHRSGL